MDHSEALAPKAAGDLVAGTAELTLANSGLTLNVPTLTGTTLLILRTTNQETTQALTSGLYELPDGVTAEEVQAALMSDYSAYRYIGPTPLAPGASSPWAFLVDPGKHYLIQEFTLDQNLQNPQIMQGAGFAVTFDIG